MILMTGSSGFIGKKLLPLVRNKYPNEKIFILDKEKHDLVTGKGLDKIRGNPRLIFHLAAETDTSKRDQRCNYIGTKNLLEALSEIGPETHFIFTSSQAIFSGRTDTDKYITSKTKPATNNQYGKTKLLAEKILLAESNKRKFKLTIIRLPTVWGDNTRKNSFLNFLREFIDTNSVFSRLNWPGKVALTNVIDASKFVLKSSLVSPKKLKIISIATENLTLAEIFKIMIEAKGKKYKQIRVPYLVWNLAIFLRKYLKYFEHLMPTNLFNYLWRASIVVDSPLSCKTNIKGVKFNS